MAERAKFIANVRSLTGRDPDAPVTPPDATGLSVPPVVAVAESERVKSVVAERAGELFEAAAQAAETAGWTVHRLDSIDVAANRVIRILRERRIVTTASSDHELLTKAGIDAALDNVGIKSGVLRDGEEGTKETAFSVGAGITGADWFIAESGTLVLHPREGVSRLVSLAPPIHIALLQPGQVLPSLDELFAIERASNIAGTLPSSINLISGPSRTGDIEATIVTGIHGPVETHLVMVGDDRG